MATRPSMRERLREEAAKAQTEGASYLALPSKREFFVPNEKDEFALDFLPFENDKSTHPKGYVKGELIPYVRFKVHAGIGAEDNKYICPTTIGKKCPICEARITMARSSKADPDLIKSLTPKERILFQLEDQNDKKKGIQLFDVSWHLFGKQLLADINKAENQSTGRKRSLAHGGFADLEEGQTLFVTFKEKFFAGKTFFEVDRIDAEDRDTYDEGILDDVVNLDDCLKILPYAELEAIFLELDPEDQGSNRKREEKEDKKEEPSRRRRGSEEEEEKQETSSRRRRGTAEEEKKEEPEPTSRRRRGAEPEKEEPASRSRRGRGEREEKPKSKCYVEGGEFGKDCDTHLDPSEDSKGNHIEFGEDGHVPNCYDCPEEIYNECRALYE